MKVRKHRGGVAKSLLGLTVAGAIVAGGCDLKGMRNVPGVSLVSGPNGKSKINVNMATMVIGLIAQHNASEQERQVALAQAERRNAQLDAARREEMRRQGAKIAVPVRGQREAQPGQTDVMVYDQESGQLASDKVYTVKDEQLKSGELSELDEYKVIYSAG